MNAVEGVRLSRHAAERAKEMGVCPHEVVTVVADPELAYPGSPRYGAGRTVYIRGALGAIVVDSTRTVITVIWHRAEGR